jgi:hypothetical protein
MGSSIIRLTLRSNQTIYYNITKNRHTDVVIPSECVPLWNCKSRLKERPPLWSRGQSSWLQILRSGFGYQICWKVLGLERDPLSLVSTTEKLLGRNSSGSGLEKREYDCGDPPRWLSGTLYPQKLALTSPTSSGRSVGIAHSRTLATENIQHECE